MYEYDAALSFAGEDRSYVEMVFDLLNGYGVKAFYDSAEQAALWGKHLHEHLPEIYGGKARFVVIFVSRHYASKAWPTLERRAALSRAMSERQEFVLPARFDDTEIPGLLPSISYIDLRKTSPAELAILICEKLGKSISASKANQIAKPRSPAENGEPTFNYSDSDGRFRLGEGAYEFETCWSRAGNGMIYCYNDPPSIKGVALAPPNTQLKDLTDVSTLNFTSRSRMAQVGQFIVLQNIRGFFAAIEIVRA
jgi:hypothetical protein